MIGDSALRVGRRELWITDCGFVAAGIESRAVWWHGQVGWHGQVKRGTSGAWPCSPSSGYTVLGFSIRLADAPTYPPGINQPDPFLFDFLDGYGQRGGVAHVAVFVGADTLKAQIAGFIRGFEVDDADGGLLEFDLLALGLAD